MKKKNVLKEPKNSQLWKWKGEILATGREIVVAK